MAESDWSTDPNANTTVGGVFIGESCPAANLNNGIRTVMAEAKAKFDSLDAVGGAASVAAIAALTPAAGKLIHYTGPTAAALTDISANALTMLAAADYAAIRVALDVPALTDFAHGSNGYGYWSKQPDGSGGVIIEQWGIATSGADGWSANLPFPLTWPTGCESIVCSQRDLNASATQGDNVAARIIDTSNFQIGCADTIAVATYWIAKGR
jgi:hypothetical protein